MMVAMMMPGRGRMMVMVVGKRQLGARDNGGLFYNRRRGCCEGEACGHDRGENNLPDAHEFPPDYICVGKTPTHSEDSG
jgi:hypothetical protein